LNEYINIKNIINIYLDKIFQFLIKLDCINNDAIICLQANQYNSVIIISNLKVEFESVINEDIFKEFNIIHLEINNIIIKTNKYCEVIDDVIIYRNINTFHQSCDNIGNSILKILKTYKFDNLLCIGGEMYKFAKLLEYNDIVCYSDHECIVEDAIANNKGVKCNLIDYDKFKIDELCIKNNNITAIMNTSKKGIGKHLCSELLKLNISRIFIISCNYKSFLKDFDILKIKYSKYKIIKMDYVNLIII
jgi:hypothetical protein